MFGKKIKTVVKLSGMSCEHCANKVKTALLELDDVKNVKIDLKNQEALLTSSSKLDKEKIKGLIENLDYEFIDVVEK